jgi:hypothetical protein
MRAIISAVLTAIALTFSATAPMIFEADLESLPAGFKRTNTPGISKSFRQTPVRNSTSAGPR